MLQQPLPRVRARVQFLDIIECPFLERALGCLFDLGERDNDRSLVLAPELRVLPKNGKRWAGVH